jgi:thymidylate synthase
MNNIFEQQYKVLLMETLLNGSLSNNRTAVKTYKKFNQTLNIDLKQGFPIITGKKIFFNKALAEFNWIYQGRTDLNFLHKHNVKWWDDFATDGQLGKVYGYQIKHFNGVFNQIDYVIKQIKDNSRRAIITLWNPTDLKDQSLPCCYTQFNFVRDNNKLNMVMHFRSSDLFLGLPYDIIVGALFLIAIAKECNLQPSMLGLNLADAHIYENHKEQVIAYNEKIIYNLPELTEDYKLVNYKCGDLIKAKLVI